MPTHFHLQGQPWQFHNTSSLHEEQPHSTIFSLTTKLSHHSENEKQQQQNPSIHYLQRDSTSALVFYMPGQFIYKSSSANRFSHWAWQAFR